LNPNWVFVGEIGLTGEVRTVSQIENRIREARKLGFEMVILPEGNRKHLSGDFKSSEMKHLAFVRDLRSLQEFLLGAPESNAKHI
jgi:DNA repair protein RadA/Sms